MRSLLYLNKYLFKYRIRLIAGLLFVILYAWFKVYSLPYVGRGIDYAVKIVINNTPGSANNPVPADVVLQRLGYYVLVILGMTLISGIFLFLTRQTIIVTSRLIEYDLKNEVFEHYQKLDTAFYRRNNTGDLMNRISEDVSRVRMYLGPAIMYTTNTVSLITFTLLVMLQTNIKLTLWVLAPMPLLYFSIYYISSLINKKSTNVQKQLSILFSKAQETFSGIRVIKSYRLEKMLVEEYDKECETYKERNMNLAKVDSLFQPAMFVLVGLSTIIVLYVGGRDILKGSLTIGEIATYMLYVSNLTMPIASLGWITSLTQRAAASQTRINEFMNTKPSISSPISEEVNIIGDIEFDHVTFVYPDSGIRALDDVSFSIKHEQSLGIVGKTGSGKSTITQLICRMYDVTGGAIKIDGKDVRELPLSSLRRQIGYVPQEVFLFSDTIANNVSFSVTEKAIDRDKIKERVEKASKDAAIYDNIMEFSEGFETMVGERGITLSGGQKQRISIARAMLKAPNIIMFDECLSAVDTNTEQEILLNIHRLMLGRTTVIVSHRISSVKMCDNILVLDRGRVIEYGTHDQLIKQKGHYYEMYEMQLTEEIVG
ncbi:MAG TPA: ABC transporter ATP-binding protein [Bacteroidia bacterium]|nr:ABC transporter ATP-binding protein [Bacteroidia bacterium]